MAVQTNLTTTNERKRNVTHQTTQRAYVNVCLFVELLFNTIPVKFDRNSQNNPKKYNRLIQYQTEENGRCSS